MSYKLVCNMCGQEADPATSSEIKVQSDNVVLNGRTYWLALPVDTRADICAQCASFIHEEMRIYGGNT